MESLSCKPETNITLYVSYMSIKKKEEGGRESGGAGWGCGVTGQGGGRPTPVLNSLPCSSSYNPPLNFPFHYPHRPLQIPLNHTENLLLFSLIRAVPSRPISDLRLLLIFSLRRLQTCPVRGVLLALCAGTSQLESSEGRGKDGSLGSLGQALTPQGLLCPPRPLSGAGWASHLNCTQAELLSVSSSCFPP